MNTMTTVPLSLVATNQSEFQFDMQPTRAGCVRKTRDMAEITACTLIDQMKCPTTFFMKNVIYLSD